MTITLEDFRKQAEFRHHLRRFLYASEVNARKAGLHPNQYQLLLCIKGMPEGQFPNITTLSERLMIETHSTVELVDRCVSKGLAERFRDASIDKRHVYVRLTEAGNALVEQLALDNRHELLASLPTFMEFLGTLSEVDVSA